MAEWSALVREGRVLLLGIVRQEVLSGIARQSDYARLRDALRAFGDVRLEVDDYEAGATCLNRCRARGTQGSPVDFLICAAAMRREASIFTTDLDFRRYARHLPLVLHSARND